jgi:hypothetical protein
MLFAYTYVPHQMERMHRFINFIVYQVWCRAPKAGAFSLDLFDANPPLKEVMTSLAYGDTQAGDRFYTQVQAIYQSFSTLPRREIAQFKRWHQGNNSLEELCANSPRTHLARYADIAMPHPILSEQLAVFFKGLYSKSLLELAALREKIGDIANHYKAFVTTNKGDKCPFCGINDLLGEYHSKREAYDHYLPKALYPFNSMNFRNLVPACHHCNSSYKTSKDPTYMPKDPAGTAMRRKVFFPFAKAHSGIDIKVTLPHVDLERMTPAEVSLSFGPAGVAEQIETWKDVYGIEERYRAKLLGADGKAWLIEVLDEWRWNEESAGGEGKPPEKYLQDVSRHTQKSPYANSNFLKHSFLQGCKEVGLFDPVNQVVAAA